MKIGIITAMPGETVAVARAIGKVRKVRSGRLDAWQGSLAGHDITFVEAGMGLQNASAAAGNLVHETHPNMIISAGYCGGIAMELQVGDIVVATGVTIVADCRQETVPVEIPASCLNFVARQAAENRRVFGGMFVTTSTIMPKRRLAALLPAHLPFPVVEMESAAIARAALENGIPFCGIRAVSDPFDEELEFSLDEFCDNHMRIRIPKVLFTIARKPRIIPQLVRLAHNSRIAGNNLKQAMERLLASM